MEHNFFLSAFLAPKQIGKPFLAVEPDPNHFPKKQIFRLFSQARKVPSEILFVK